ncbi:hypothetical protein M422DRAFT_259598 [Sphaerobolus stellatus SS14]|uniref:Uncharacterized protein n=1 Tax=Sphaerobolus stellatus (strain SS14) TaxID=990650 RepID=A0A0C9V8A7_SPHS4|nr:hypothetical protein M422DRAFT_259598 [Sphaerobolus stellatus SS14]
MASGSSNTADSSSKVLAELLKAVDEETIRAYRARHVAAAIWRAAPDHFAIGNAHGWVQLEPFLDFVAKRAQQPEPRTPKHSRPLPDSSSPNGSGAQDPSEGADVDYANSDHPPKRRRNESHSTPPPSSPTPQSRALIIPMEASFTVSLPDIPADQQTLDSGPSNSNNPRRRKRTTQAEMYLAANRVQISKKVWVDGVINVTEVMESWPISNDGKTIIKNACTDGWEGGTGGYKSRPTTVFALDGELCQRSSQKCQGSFLCSLRNPKLWEGYERWKHDFEPFRELFHQDMEQNAAEHESPLGYAVSFYNSVKYEACHFNDNCNGHAVLRRFQETSTEGKNYFVGCSAWKPSDGKTSEHLFRLIPNRVSEDLIVEIFTYGGPLELHEKLFCCHSVPCRTGLRQKLCPRDHIRDGKVVDGHIEQRPCTAGLTIYTPVNKKIRKAIVIPEPNKPHNHPSYSSEKLTFEAAEIWRTAVRVTGPLGKQSVKFGVVPPTTMSLLAERGADQSSSFSCLARPRYLLKILTEEKQRLYPKGFDLAGLNDIYENRELKLATNHPDRYIHAILSEPSDDGAGQINVIVTMVPGLAQYTHEAQTTLHDNTYKCVHGKFNEWEVVIWDSKGNRRITVARIYCNRETRQAFRLIWSGWLNALENATGRRLKIKPLHKEGKLGTMLMDGSAPQIQGLGDVLIRENNPAVSGIMTTDATEIVQWLTRTCDWHFKHNLDPLSEVLTKEDMDRIRLFRFIPNQEDMDTFIQWASTHPEKKLRNWMANKLAHPWYIPSLCQHFSKIPQLDWKLSPADNNLNESSHPAANRATGTCLSLVEAIEMARPYDVQIYTDRKKLDETCVQKNPHNTIKHCLASNGHRMNSRAQKANEDHEVRAKLMEIQKRKANLDERKRQLAAESKALREEKKQTSGGKKRRINVPAGHHPTLPDFGDVVPRNSDKENLNPFLENSYGPTPFDLPPELEPPPQSNYPVPYSIQSHPFNSQSAFPPSTCPPSFYIAAIRMSITTPLDLLITIFNFRLYFNMAVQIPKPLSRPLS